MFSPMADQPQDPFKGSQNNWQELSQEHLAAVRNKFKTGMFNILIVGCSGAGKSTLVNEIFEGNFATTGPSEPVTMETRKYTKKGVPLAIYDTRGLELIKCNQILDELLGFVKENQDRELHQRIHVAWLCIVDGGGHIEDVEKKLTRRLTQFMPVIGVITKARATDQGFRSTVQQLLPEAKNVVRVRAIEEPLGGGRDPLPKKGLDDLVEATAQVLPEGEVLRAFAIVQKSIKLKKKQAGQVMLAAVVSAAGAGGIPVPLVGQGLLVPIQVGMLVYISKVFGINVASAEFWQDLVVGLAASLTGVTIGIGTLGTVLKFIPGMGTLTGAAILSSSSAVLTYKLGDWYIGFLVKRITESGDKLPSLEVIKQGFKEFSDKIQKRNFKVAKTKT